MIKVIHNIHFPVTARSVVTPMVKRLNSEHITTELWTENNSSYKSILQKIDIPKKYVDSNFELNPLNFFRKLSKFCLALRDANPDILHAHQTRGSVISLLAACLEGVPVRIYHNHGLPFLGYKGPIRWMLRLLEVINIRLATHILLVSHGNLEAAQLDGLLSKDQGVVIRSGSAAGIDLNEFQMSHFDKASAINARNSFSIVEEAFVLAYVGRPVKRKGFHLLIKAWEYSGLGENGNVLLVAGCTADECNAVLGYSVAGVRGLGYLTDLKPFYAACDAVTLPSEHEGFPNAMLEGAAAGKPLIGTDIPGVRCTIHHDHTGLLVPTGNEIALSNVIKRLASDEQLRIRLGKNARKRVEEEFSREIVFQGLLDFYRNELDCQLEPHANAI